jgi:glutamate racemase
MLKNKTKKIIGVFDSGIGGLSILKHFLKKLPQYDYVYLGDTARVPYGNHSQETIYSYTKEAVDFLFSQNCQLIVLACNTASSQALRRLQQEYLPKKYPKQRILGVIVPLAEEVSKNNKIGVIGTRATISSRAYEQEIKKINPKTEIISHSTPLLVPIIEEANVSRAVSNKVLKKYLRPLKQANIKNLILGCTHYPFLIKDIRRIMGKNCQVADPGLIVADKLADYLKRHPEFAQDATKKGERIFYLTDKSDNFISLGSKFLGEKIDNWEIVKL